MKINKQKMRVWQALSIMTVFIAAFAVTFNIVKNLNTGVNATTPSGSMVDLTKGEILQPTGQEWFTNKFTITSGSQNFVGVCAQPGATAPDTGQVEAITVPEYLENTNKLKLMLYIFTGSTSEATSAMNTIFSTFPSGSSLSNNDKYAYVHRVVGYLNNGSLTNLSQQVIDWIKNDVERDFLIPNITNNTNLWKQADKYLLYATDNSSTGRQKIMWIERTDDTARGDLKFVKKDNNGNPMANVLFSLTAQNSSQESHILVSNENGVVNTASSFALHSNNTNLYDQEYQDPILHDKIRFRGYGTWFGLDEQGHQLPVNDSVGALPAGSYLIQELECPANASCSNIDDEKQTFTITTDGQTVDLGTWENNCSSSSLRTTATDNQDGDHYIAPVSQATIKDHVEYCASKGISYTIKGVLMDKSTGQPLNIGGQTFEQTVSVTPSEDCGSVDMLFTIDASQLGGKDIVVFETLYQGTQIIASHTDINDSGQTVRVTEPETSLRTTATDNQDGDHYIEVAPQVTIKDHVEFCANKGVAYTIKGTLMDKETGEPLTIDGQTFEQSVDITPTENCGSVDMLFTIDASKLGGKEIVVFEKLYQGSQIITTHEDINDTGQTVTIVELHTLATNKATGEKNLPANQDVEIKDVVTYCLKPGQQYTLKGVLMNKNTKEVVQFGGVPVTAEVTFTPTEKCGQTEFYYQLNTSSLAGAELVSFEYLYLEGTVPTPILSHEDFNDSGETVTVDTPEIVPGTEIITPETGHSSASSSAGFGPLNPILVGGAVAVCVVPYLAMRIVRRRKILK